MRRASRRARATPFRWRPKGGESYEDLMVRSVGWLDGVTRRHGRRRPRRRQPRAARPSLGLDAGNRARAAGAAGSHARPARATACIGCRRRAKERAGAAAAPALPSDVRCPLGDGCSEPARSGADVGHDQGRPVTLYLACDTRPADLAPLKHQKHVNLWSQGEACGDRRSPPNGGIAERSRIT